MITNADLLRKTLSHIETHPDRWDQGDYRTCFAAHACQLSGAQWVVPADTDHSNPDYYLVRPADEDLGHYTVPVWTYAASVLGIDVDWGMLLFSAYNSLADLQHMVADILEESWPEPEPVPA